MSKLVIFDVDGTLRYCPSGQVCPNRPGDSVLFDDVKGPINELLANGVKIALVSNQRGVSKGYFSFEMAEKLLHDTWNEISSVSVPILFECGKNPTRAKPSPQMLGEAMVITGVRYHDTLMVGDMVSDEKAAEAAGCSYKHREDFFPNFNIEYYV